MFLTAQWRYLAMVNFDGSTIEYRVEHPRWRVRQVRSAEVVGNLERLYGPAMAEVVRGTTASAFLADGSVVTVRAPVRLTILEG